MLAALGFMGCPTEGGSNDNKPEQLSPSPAVTGNTLTVTGVPKGSAVYYAVLTASILNAQDDEEGIIAGMAADMSSANIQLFKRAIFGSDESASEPEPWTGTGSYHVLLVVLNLVVLNLSAGGQISDAMEYYVLTDGKGIDILNLDKVAKLSVEGKTSVAFNRFQNVPPELIRLVMGTLPIDFGGAY